MLCPELLAPGCVLTKAPGCPAPSQDAPGRGLTHRLISAQGKHVLQPDAAHEVAHHLRHLLVVDALPPSDTSPAYVLQYVTMRQKKYHEAHLSVWW